MKFRRHTTNTHHLCCVFLSLRKRINYKAKSNKYLNIQYSLKIRILILDVYKACNCIQFSTINHKMAKKTVHTAYIFNKSLQNSHYTVVGVFLQHF